jgi:hypothetical protein
MKKIIFSLALVTPLVFTACLKDKGYSDLTNDNSAVPVAEIADISAGFTETSFGLEVTPTVETVEIATIRVGTRSVNDRIFKVTLVKNTTLISDYNAANSTNFIELPANAFTWNPIVTVPAGSNTAVLKITINKAAVSLTSAYGIGFQISAADNGAVISRIADRYLCLFQIKNQYDGCYDVTGYFFHPSVPRAFSFTGANCKHASTVSDVRSEFELADLAGWYFRMDISGTAVSNWAGAGAAPAAPASGFMTSDNPGGAAYAPLTPGTAPWVHTTYNNSYNPATKTLLLHYGYAGGSTGQNGYTRQIYEKWVKQ